ncbi:NAD-dependent epimerase/dehydratase family protein [Microbacterium sp. NPDC076895]|uniref:NAD-dependent epimerase/dehydratase family protein n=1 Tax=Microbacterium sp. NPDC076895 TaxID=3154957 RepID=UPI00343A10DD
MRRILVLGGTGWLGQHVASAALAEGAEVTCLARGDSGAPPDGAHHVVSDRRDPDAYATLAGEWDEVIELTYDREFVTGALTALSARAAHWTLVSTISVYADAATPGADESSPVVEPQGLANYADAKVAAERTTAAARGASLLVARPGLIVGPGDPSDRFGYWPGRLDRGGDVLVPDLRDRFAQVIDVADLAAWIIDASRSGHTGVMDAVGPSIPMSELFDVVRDVTAFDGDLISVDDETLVAHDIAYWAGPRSLPLWLPADHTGFAQRSGAAYLSAGGKHRPLREIIERAHADELARGRDRPRRAGMSAAEEAGVLRAMLA